MASDSGDRRSSRDSWDELVTRGVDLGAGMLRLYGETARDLMTRKMSYTATAERAADLARHEGSAYARAVSRATVDYWTRVFEAGRELGERVVAERRADGAAGTTASAQESARAASRARLDFHGKAGEEVARSFVVENNQPETVSVSFEVSPFFPEGGGEGRKLPLSLEPETFELPPGSEQIVTCQVTLTEDCPAGVAQRAILRVMGFPGLEIELAVLVS